MCIPRILSEPTDLSTSLPSSRVLRTDGRGAVIFITCTCSSFNRLSLVGGMEVFFVQEAT